MDFKNKSYKELIEIRENSTPGGDIFEQSSKKIEQIQHDTNNNQIANLINEISDLKNITEKSSKETSRLAKIAIYISLTAVVLQAIFSIHQEVTCDYTTQGHTVAYTKYIGCKRIFDWGMFGKYQVTIPDYEEKNLGAS